MLKKIVPRSIVLDVEGLPHRELRPRFCIRRGNSSQDRFANPVFIQYPVTTPADVRTPNQLHGYRRLFRKPYAEEHVRWPGDDRDRVEAVLISEMRHCFCGSITQYDKIHPWP